MSQEEIIIIDGDEIKVSDLIFTKKGIVKMLHKNGFGWIAFDNEPKNVFFHASKIVGGIKFDYINKGAEIETTEIRDKTINGSTKREAIIVRITNNSPTETKE